MGAVGMRKRLLIVLAVLLLLLAGCGSKVYTVSQGGKEFTVDPVNRTVTDGQQTYTYEIGYGATGYDLKITYPDGSCYLWETEKGIGTGGGSLDYDANRYVPGEILRDVLEQGAIQQSADNNKALYFVLKVLLLAFGVFQAVFPEKIWYINRGWAFKDAEPSGLALGVYRAGGVLIGLLALVLFFV